VSAQANEINLKYGLVEKGQAVLNVASEKAAELGNTIASTAAYQATIQKAAEIDSKLQISKTATDLFDLAKAKATKLVDETNKEIAAQQAQVQQQQQQPQPQPQPQQAQVQQNQTPQEVQLQGQPQPGNLYPSLQ